MRTEGPQKDFSIVSSMTPSNGGNGLQHRSASSSSLQGEKEREDRGPAPRRSAADAAPKKNGDQAKRARATYTWSHEASVDRALHGERSWEHGRGTPHSWTIIEHVVEQKTIWTWTWAHVAALTTGRILVHNLLRASTQVLHTRASELEVGESPDYWSGATAWELTTPHHSWLKSERRSYGVWDTGCYCNACQPPGIAASFSMGNRLLAQHLPSLLPINKTAHVHTRSQDASFVLQYACATRIQGSGTLCRRQRRRTINKTTRLCIYTSVSWRSAYTCIASGQQSLSHCDGCVPARKHCRSAYLCCLPSTTGRGHVSARILG